MKKQSLSDQIQSNTVAIISLIIAIVALCYTTWREELTEKNRNIRQASFEVLKHLGELQIVVNNVHYDPNNSMSNPMLGWGHIALISDLSELLPEPIPTVSEKLIHTWNETWSTIKSNEENTSLISSEIDNVRAATLETLRILR